LDQWEFEQEYRLQNFWPRPVNPSEREYKVSRNAFSEVVLGEKVSKKCQLEIIALAKIINPQIKINIASKRYNKVVITPYKFPPSFTT